MQIYTGWSLLLYQNLISAHIKLFLFPKLSHVLFLPLRKRTWYEYSIAQFKQTLPTNGLRRIFKLRLIR